MPNRLRTLSISLGLLLILAGLSAACGSSASPTAPTSANASATVAPGSHATASSTQSIPATPVAGAGTITSSLVQNHNGPDLHGIAKWFNSPPTTIGAQNAKHRVVLVDFWTYTCVNCIRTFPYLKSWYQKYADHGLTIIGVQSPEFEFEKVPANVEHAIQQYGLNYPIAMDNNLDTWKAFNNIYWPAEYLFNTSGKIVHTHFGEGDYASTEQAIRAQLEKAGYDLSGIPATTPPPPKAAPGASLTTRELYMGYKENYGFGGQYAGQDAFYRANDQTTTYTDDGKHVNGKWYLQGVWTNRKESIVHARTTPDFKDYIALKVSASSVNVVATPLNGASPEIDVEMDGKPLTKDQAGSDVTFDASGRSIVKVNQSRMYNIVRLPKFGTHELKLYVKSADLAVYSFTFGANQTGP